MPKKNNENLIIGSNYDKVLIFSHGLGDDPSSWLFFANEIKKEIKNIKIILTKSPIIPVSVNNNLEMPGWFDIKKMPIDTNHSLHESYDYIDNSVEIIHDLIDKEKINPDKIFLGGFSQGASLSLQAGLKYKYKLGGIIVLSGWLIDSTMKNHNDTPIFIGHGTKDDIVKYENSKVSYDLLKYKTSLISFKSYENMKHSVSLKERYDVIDWINKY